jgi:hypothetical protein
LTPDSTPIKHDINYFGMAPAISTIRTLKRRCDSRDSPSEHPRSSHSELGSHVRNCTNDVVRIVGENLTTLDSVGRLVVKLGLS